MAFIVWDEVYETDIRSIDEQHKHLVSLLNRMLEALSQKKGKEEVLYVIEEMNQFARCHFLAEELLMEKAGYPDLAEHRLFHDAFSSKVDDFLFKYRQNDESLSAEVTIFLTNWLNEHLSSIDSRYIQSIKSLDLPD
ncbi:bacteriohemerythrin [Methanospirillum sp.]|uniref:bacteriohemerythrin n=1 Tax=Methanospirillum sp. TaxID=45200 RepID=UPI002983C610|nr:bacteriohemerythrin [Methanospirillum sp.]